MNIFDFYERLDGKPCPGAKNMHIEWRIVAIICFFPTVIRNFFKRTFSPFCKKQKGS